MKYAGLAILIVWVSAEAIAKPVLRARLVSLNERAMETVAVTPGRGVVLNFPARPTKVILGGKGLFAIEYVESDLVVTALRHPAHSNLFVYLEGRRFALDLRTTEGTGDEIILIRDDAEKTITPRVRE